MHKVGNLNLVLKKKKEEKKKGNPEDACAAIHRADRRADKSKVGRAHRCTGRLSIPRSLPGMELPEKEHGSARNRGCLSVHMCVSRVCAELFRK